MLGTEVLGTEVLGTEVLGAEVLGTKVLGTQVLGTKGNDLRSSYERQWTEMYHYGWDEANIFRDWISETKNSVRIYLVLGDSDTHLAMLEAMHDERLFDATGVDDANDRYYFVVGVRADAWDPNGKNFLIF